MKKNLPFIITLCMALNFNAQRKDSVKSFNEPLEFRVKKLAAPVALIGAGTAIMLTEKRNTEVYGKTPFFGHYFENYAQYAPFTAGLAFEMAGMKSRTDRANKLAIAVKGAMLNFGASFALRHIIKKPSPDGSTQFSIPAGPVTTAFAGATTLSIEYGENYPWVPYAAYAVAGGVGALRAAHHKSYWSDVIFSAGLGILTSKIAYWTHHYKWRSKQDNKIMSGIEYIK